MPTSFNKLLADAAACFPVRVEESNLSLAEEEEIERYERLFANHSLHSGGREREDDEEGRDRDEGEDDGEPRGRGFQVRESDLERLRVTVRQVAVPRARDALPSAAEGGGLAMKHYTPKNAFAERGESERASERKRVRLPADLAVRCPPVDWEREVSLAMELSDHDNEEEEQEEEEEEEQEEDGEHGKTPAKRENAPLSALAKAAAAKKVRESHAAASEDALPPVLLLCPAAHGGAYSVAHGAAAVASFACFDADFVDVERTADALDVVIPNAPLTGTGTALAASGHIGPVSSNKALSANATSATPTTTAVVVPVAVADERERERAVVGKNRATLFAAVRAATRDNQPLRTVHTDKVVSRQEEEKRRLDEKRQRIAQVSLAWVDASASIRKTATKRARNASMLLEYGTQEDVSLNHHPDAAQHRLVRPDLSEFELRCFHRPHLKERDFRAEIKVKKNRKDKKSPTSSNTALNAGAVVEKTLDAARLLRSEKERLNLNVAQGDAPFVLIEYVEEFPPIALNVGMTSAIVNYFRASKDDGEEEDDNDEDNEENEEREKEREHTHNTQSNNKRAAHTHNKFSEKAIESIKRSVADTQYRVPRHVLQLWELKHRRRPYDYDAAIPRLEIGQTKVLDSEDASPFLGKIQRGEVQAAIVNKLFRAPLFRHTPQSTDFLLVCRHRGGRGEKTLQLVLREIPFLFLAGQCEPLRVVPRPAPGKASDKEEVLFRLALLRYLQARPHGADFASIARALLLYSGHDFSPSAVGGRGKRDRERDRDREEEQAAQHVQLPPHRAAQRRLFVELLKALADAHEVDGVVKYFPRSEERDRDEDEHPHHHRGGASRRDRERDGEEERDAPRGRKGGASSSAAAQRERERDRESEESLALRITPEDVCLLHAAQAAEYRLLRCGVSDVDLGRLHRYLDHLHRLLQQKRTRRDAWLALDCVQRHAHTLSPTHTHTHREMTLTTHTHNTHTRSLTLREVLDRDIARTRERQEIARFLLHHLARAPWNTTLTFVQSVVEKDNRGCMEVSAHGDPSGRAEGFAFYRPDTAALHANTEKKPKYFDTDSDLRRLHAKDAIRVLVSLGIAEREAHRMKRWDRIHVMRTMITDMKRRGVLDASLEKYARDADKGGVSREQFARLCENIWARQRLVLSARDPPPPEHALPSVSLSHRSQRDRERDTEREGEGEGDGEDGAMRRDALKQQSLSLSLSQSQAGGAAPNGSSNGSAGAATTAVAVSVAAMESDSSDSDDDLNAFQAFLSGNGSGSTAARRSGGVRERDREISSSAAAEREREREKPVSLPAHLLCAPPEGWTRPTHVVRRLVKKIDKTGRETLSISFVFDRESVAAAAARAALAKREREQRRLYAYSGGSASDAAERERQLDAAAVADYAPGGAGGGALSLSLKRMSSIAAVHRAEHDDEPQSVLHGTASRPRNKALSSSSSLSLSMRERDGESGADEHALGPAKTSSSKRSRDVAINLRAPRISFSARLEKTLFEAWQLKIAADFRFAVPASVPGYYERIERPICLADIREKIAQFEYETAQQLLADLELMASNAAQFNGAQSVLAKNAVKVREYVKKQLEHDRVTLGPEKDAVGLIEEAIARNKNK